MLSKVYTIATAIRAKRTGFTTTHSIELKRSVDQIDLLRRLTVLLFVVVLMLFTFTVVLAFGQRGQELHNYLGGISVIISSVYILRA
jgi:hypothetical protein